jgi:D-inositol-3-phosphate glycosyltransferase
VRVVRLPVAFECSYRVWLRRLFTTLREIDPEYLHVHSFTSFNALRAARFLSRLRSTLIVDDHMLNIASKNRWGWLARPLFRVAFANAIYRHSDAIVAVTQETRDYLISRYGISGDKLIVIPLGVAIEEFHPSDEKRRMKRLELGVREDEVLVLCTGKMDPLKDPIRALHAAKLLRAGGLSFRLVFVGPSDPAYRRRMEQFAEQGGMSDIVAFHDAVPAADLAAYFNAADLAVWPTHCSMSSLESIACGCPVLLADLPVNIERLAGEPGMSFANGNWDDLASKMALLISDSQARNRLARNARQAMPTWTWNKISETFLTLGSPAH